MPCASSRYKPSCMILEDAKYVGPDGERPETEPLQTAPDHGGGPSGPCGAAADRPKAGHTYIKRNGGQGRAGADRETLQTAGKHPLTSRFHHNSPSSFRKTAVLITVLLQNPKTYLQSKKAVLKYFLQGRL